MSFTSQNKHNRRRNAHTTCMWRFGDLKEDSVGLQVSDLKTYKVDVIDIVLRFTEVS